MMDKNIMMDGVPGSEILCHGWERPECPWVCGLLGLLGPFHLRFFYIGLVISLKNDAASLLSWCRSQTLVGWVIASFKKWALEH